MQDINKPLQYLNRSVLENVVLRLHLCVCFCHARNLIFPLLWDEHIWCFSSVIKQGTLYNPEGWYNKHVCNYDPCEVNIYKILCWIALNVFLFILRNCLVNYFKIDIWFVFIYVCVYFHILFPECEDLSIVSDFPINIYPFSVHSIFI